MKPVVFVCDPDSMALCVGVASSHEWVEPGSVSEDARGVSYRLNVPPNEHASAELAVRRSLELAVALHRADKP
jgi:hypothetical protein